MVSYVKFLKGTSDAFSKLSNKSNDTLYFIYENENSETGSLYLGSKKISDGNIKQFLPDNLTISKTEDNKLKLSNFGERFYVYDSQTSEYVLTEVSEDYPWEVGLEPRVTTNENGEFILGWYQPSTADIDGLEAALSALSDKVDGIEGSIAELDIEGKISSAIAATSLLSYKIVDSKESIVPTAADAHKYIYMVKNGNVYDEYMVVNGSVETIGDTAVDLSDYAKTSEVEAALETLATKEELQAVALDLENLGKTVTELTNKNVTILSDISDLKTKVNKNSEDIINLQTMDGTLSDKIDALKEMMQWGEIK